METGNSTSLEKRIKSWRSEMSGKLSPDDIDELQSHLEDSINELLKKGIPEEEAWLLATHRMGSAETIKQEFRKVKDSRVPLFHRILYWLIVIILAIQVLNICRKVISYFLLIEAVPVFNSVLIAILLLIITWITYKRRRIVKSSLGVILRTILLIFVALCFGFFSEFQEPGCRNANKIFETNSPRSEVYNSELIRLFTRFGTDNLYYQFGFYFHENGRDYIMVNTIGKDFCAVFPLDITNSDTSSFENVIRVKGMGYHHAGLKGLKFDLISSKKGTEFIFRSLEQIVD